MQINFKIILGITVGGYAKGGAIFFLSFLKWLFWVRRNLYDLEREPPNNTSWFSFSARFFPRTKGLRMKMGSCKRPPIPSIGSWKPGRHLFNTVTSHRFLEHYQHKIDC